MNHKVMHVVHTLLVYAKDILIIWIYPDLRLFRSRFLKFVLINQSIGNWHTNNIISLYRKRDTFLSLILQRYIWALNDNSRLFGI